MFDAIALSALLFLRVDETKDNTMNSLNALEYYRLTERLAIID